VSETKHSVETICRVYDDNEGVCIEVGPDSDVGGYVEIRTEGKSAEYFGATRIAFPPAMARMLAKAILAVAEALETDE
jgi:hypothetical protein